MNQKRHYLRILGTSRKMRFLAFFILLTSSLIYIDKQALSQLSDYSVIVDNVSPCVVSVSALIVEKPEFTMIDNPEIQIILEENLTAYGMPLESRNSNIGHRHSGTGIVFSENGYIVTNDHIIAGGEDYLVTMENGLRYPATLIGNNEETDIAVLKIDAMNLKLCPLLVDNEDVKAGQLVLGIGSPFTMQGSVTQGIISYVNRPLPIMGISAHYVLFIQTNLMINAGNSGGPIVNLDGEIIGINSKLLSSTGVSSGVSFAIPMSLVNRVASQLIQTGKHLRGDVGIEAEDIPPDVEIVRLLGLQTPTGAIITNLEPGSPADEAGVLVGDIVVALNHNVVNNHHELHYQIALREKGDILRLAIIRNRNIFTTNAIVSEVDSK